VVASAAQVRAGERLDAQWADGVRAVRIEPDEK
jgi:hypothetical protein